jgi:hypothetical protein
MIEARRFQIKGVTAFSTAQNRASLRAETEPGFGFRVHVMKSSQGNCGNRCRHLARAPVDIEFQSNTLAGIVVSPSSPIAAARWWPPIWTSRPSGIRATGMARDRSKPFVLIAFAKSGMWLGGVPGRGTGCSGLRSARGTSITPGRGVPTRGTEGVGEPLLLGTRILEYPTASLGRSAAAPDSCGDVVTPYSAGNSGDST